LSTLTKILIILLTISAIFLCGIVVTYVANADNYRQKYDQLRVRLDQTKQKLTAATKLANEKVDGLKQLNQNFNRQVADLKRQNDKLKVSFNNSEREKATLLQKVNNWTSIAKDFHKTNQQQERLLEDTLRKLDSTETTKIKQEKELKQTTKTLFEKMAVIDSLQKEQRRLAEEKAEIEQRLNQILLPAGKTATAPTPVTLKSDAAKPATSTIETPVAENIQLKGKVSKVDSQNGLVEISIGTADGVKTGMRFHVIRKDAFISDILIVEVDPEQAVGVLEIVQQQPEVGDVVTTNF